MQAVKDVKDINSESEEDPLETAVAEKQRSNSLSEELIQRGRGRPKKDQRPKTSSIDAYFSPRTEKRKLKESPGEDSKKEIKRKCSTEMEGSGIETSALLTQILEKLGKVEENLRKTREEVDKIQKTQKTLMEDSRKTGEEVDKIQKTLKEDSKERREEQEKLKKSIMDFTNKLVNIETKTKQIEERVEADERNLEKIKEEGEKSKSDLERTKKRLNIIEEKVKKLTEKNKDLEMKEERIESQLEKKIMEKMENVDDFKQMVKKSAKEIIEKQGQKKEVNNNIKNEERKWEEWERERRKNNFVIKGIGSNERIDKRKIEDWVEEKLGVRVKLNKIWIIKKLALVGAECRNKEEKDKIMENKKKLRGTKLYVDNDLTYKERRNKEELWKIAKKHREQGKMVKIGYNKLIVDEEIHKWDEWKGELFRISYKTSRRLQ